MIQKVKRLNLLYHKIVFMDFIKSRSIEMGHSIGVKHGEGFTSETKLKLTSLGSFF